MEQRWQPWVKALVANFVAATADCHEANLNFS
ncbi:hypothetical protein COLO4_35017 [Corchorus olitorius]|uniref:Uncharacterized protein n=1 Tax=Corchorus olitorius TaxID=93759 RepID=A0A1R3GIJ4_9ROSI|nr:hypothetical protein COLO4_35017 [Corchorus olitorius]